MEILEEAWEQIHRHASALAQMSAFPIWTEHGRWNTIGFESDEQGILPHHGSWMVGDLPAILWFSSAAEAYAGAKNGRAEQAVLWSGRLKNRTTLKSFASVGHMFFRGTLIGMTLGSASDLEPIALEAARTVSDRFLEIGYMKSFGLPADTRFSFTTIDDVINLAVPLWLSRRTRDPELGTAAHDAISLLADRLIRSDGSTGQVLNFDLDNQPTSVETYQGFKSEGCWSRGQAWGIYGLASAYRVCGDPEFLQLAEMMTDYWMDRVQDEPSPLWDFDLPSGEPSIRDTFAATLAYAGILELANASGEGRREQLVGYVREMLRRLAEKYVLGRGAGTGIVGGAALDVPHKHGIDESVIVGDSYFVEAVWRLRVLGAGGQSPSLFPDLLEG